MTTKKVLTFTDKDFESIKNACLLYAKKYYPNSYKNFSSTSFGSMIVDIISDVGDNLAYYIDYNTNENLLENAVEFRNIEKIAKQMGFKQTGQHSSRCKQDFFIRVPSDLMNRPDENYLPKIKTGTIVSTISGVNFTVEEDIDFASEDISFVVADVNAAGFPTSYAVKASGYITSGEEVSQTVNMGAITGFPKVLLNDPNFIEIISVTDSNGNEYYQVDNLSQSIITRSIPNSDSNDNKYTKYYLKKEFVNRKFIVDRISNVYFLTFGNGKNDDISNSTDLLLDMYGKQYNNNKFFDPNKLVVNNTMGIAPVNTTLFIKYRTSKGLNSDVDRNTITNLKNLVIQFPDTATDQNIIDSISSSIETNNPEQANGLRNISFSEEIKYLAYGAYSSQNRAVTKGDYEFLCYNMLPKYGSIKRANAVMDFSSFNKMINIYVIGQNNTTDFLTQVPLKTKENLKTHLQDFKMMNDIVNILDAKIVNIKIDFTAIAVTNKNKFDVLQECYAELRRLYRTKMYIGQPFSISDVYKVLNDLPNVIDVKDVKVSCLNSSDYSQVYLDIPENTNNDGSFIICPDDYIFEIKNLNTDIKGIIIQ
jgi:hypothetical protein